MTGTPEALPYAITFNPETHIPHDEEAKDAAALLATGWRPEQCWYILDVPGGLKPGRLSLERWAKRSLPLRGEVCLGPCITEGIDGTITVYRSTGPGQGAGFWSRNLPVINTYGRHAVQPDVWAQPEVSACPTSSYPKHR